VDSAQHGPGVAVVPSAAIGRVVALGASNLTLGFPAVVSSARAAWGPQVEVLAALGHGRSYGAQSRVLFRRLPAILESGLWPGLEPRPQMTTRGLVTDVGNDILYGFSAERTLEWVEEAIRRLNRVTRDVVVTDLPLDRIRRLSNAKFLMFRSVLVPSCRLSLTQVRDRTERVSEGLAALAAATGSRLVRPDPTWYGFDPVHFRRSSMRVAWRQILGIPPATSAKGGSGIEAVRLFRLPPRAPLVIRGRPVHSARGCEATIGRASVDLLMAPAGEPDGQC
jgi:hypothetical protein